MTMPTPTDAVSAARKSYSLALNEQVLTPSSSAAFVAGIPASKVFAAAAARLAR
jgi:hypothetical protein